jgi:hypothetical protein
MALVERAPRKGLPEGWPLPMVTMGLPEGWPLPTLELAATESVGHGLQAVP